MSVSSGSPNSSRKLLNLSLFLLVIALMFGAIVAIWAMSGSQNNPGTSVINNGNDTHASGTVGSITRVSFLKSLDLLRSGNDTASWFQSNPQWRLFQAQADYVDGSGLSRHWSMIFSSPNSSLIAFVDNGVPFMATVEDAGRGDMPPVSDQAMKDSIDIIDNATTMKGIGTDADSTPFAMFFSDDGGDGIYLLSYNNPADVSSSFNITYNARSGELIEDTE